MSYSFGWGPIQIAAPVHQPLFEPNHVFETQNLNTLITVIQGGNNLFNFPNAMVLPLELRRSSCGLPGFDLSPPLSGVLVFPKQHLSFI